METGERAKMSSIQIGSTVMMDDESGRTAGIVVEIKDDQALVAHITKSDALELVTNGVEPELHGRMWHPLNGLILAADRALEVLKSMGFN